MAMKFPTCPNITFLSLAIELNTETAARSSNGTRGETSGLLFYFKGAISLSLRHIVLFLWGDSFISFFYFVDHIVILFSFGLKVSEILALERYLTVVQ